jgi:hypothetical protein
VLTNKNVRSIYDLLQTSFCAFSVCAFFWGVVGGGGGGGGVFLFGGGVFFFRGWEC